MLCPMVTAMSAHIISLECIAIDKSGRSKLICSDAWQLTLLMTVSLVNRDGFVIRVAVILHFDAINVPADCSWHCERFCNKLHPL